MAQAPLTLVPETFEHINEQDTLPSGPETAAPADPQPLPRVVGGWRVHSKLGRGATAVVYAVRCGRLLAVMKVERAGASSSARRCIVQEAIWLRHNGGSGRPQLLDEGRLEDGRAWFVMTMAPGQDLAAWWQQGGRREPNEAVRIVASAARIMGDAHQQGWIHRDLKPANIAVGPDGEVTILDWGLAFGLQQRGVTTALAGTPGFIPPEMFKSRRSTVAAQLDTYALGCSLIMLLSKRHLKPAELTVSTIRTVVAEAGIVGIPARTLEHILAKAISPMPGQRWTDGHKLAAELECWLRCMAPVATASGTSLGGDTWSAVYRTPA